MSHGPGPVLVAPPEPERAAVEPGRRLSISELARLWSTTTSQIDRLVRQGMPALDLSCPRPGRRPKHLWRLDPQECAAWLKERRP